MAASVFSNAAFNAKLESFHQRVSGIRDDEILMHARAIEQRKKEIRKASQSRERSGSAAAFKPGGVNVKAEQGHDDGTGSAAGRGHGGGSSSSTSRLAAMLLRQPRRLWHRVVAACDTRRYNSQGYAVQCDQSVRNGSRRGSGGGNSRGQIAARCDDELCTDGRYYDGGQF